MKFFSKICFFLCFLGMSSIVQVTQIYLFQSGDSCCLHYKGVDITNPHVPCTGFIQKDLMGISAYISRMLQGDQIDYEQREFLLEVQKYIKSLLFTRSLYIAYRFDIKRIVDFYHEALEKKKKQDAYLAKKKKDNAKELEAAEKARKEKQMQEDMKNLGLLVQRLKKKK